MAAEGKKRELKAAQAEACCPSILLYIFNEICEEDESLTRHTQMLQHMERRRTAIFLWLLKKNPVLLKFKTSQVFACIITLGKESVVGDKNCQASICSLVLSCHNKDLE